MADNKIHVPFYPVPTEKPVTEKKGGKKFAPQEGESFAGILEKSKAAKGLDFSAHAKQRLQARGIKLEPKEVRKLEEAVEKAAAKGCLSSLLLYRDMAFVAGVENRTIVTAVNGQHMKEHIFTNIDSAVIIE